jgi:hypothetical protein
MTKSIDIQTNPYIRQYKIKFKSIGGVGAPATVRPAKIRVIAKSDSGNKEKEQVFFVLSGRAPKDYEHDSLVSRFPGLNKREYSIIKEQNVLYNCIAYSSNKVEPPRWVMPTSCSTKEEEKKFNGWYKPDGSIYTKNYYSIALNHGDKEIPLTNKDWDVFYKDTINNTLTGDEIDGDKSKENKQEDNMNTEMEAYSVILYGYYDYDYILNIRHPWFRIGSMKVDYSKDIRHAAKHVYKHFFASKLGEEWIIIHKWNQLQCEGEYPIADYRYVIRGYK